MTNNTLKSANLLAPPEKPTGIKKLFLNIICGFVKSPGLRYALRRNMLAKYMDKKREICNQKPNAEFQNYLSVVAIAKNEGQYFKEWIEYYKLMGVNKFYIYDNESDDDTYNVLLPYIESGLVDYKYVKGDKMQMPTYWDAIAQHKNATKWITFIDLDEFVVPTRHNNLVEYLQSCADGRGISSIIMGWRFFGSSGHKTKPAGLVMENYQYRGKKFGYHKSILNPRSVFCFPNPHTGYTVGRNLNEKCSECRTERIRVNHYFCKSEQEYLQKRARGDAFFGAMARNRTYSDAAFKKNDRNEIYDPIMDRFIPQVKAAMA